VSLLESVTDCVSWEVRVLLRLLLQAQAHFTQKHSSVFTFTALGRLCLLCGQNAVQTDRFQDTTAQIGESAANFAGQAQAHPSLQATLFVLNHCWSMFLLAR